MSLRWTLVFAYLGVVGLSGCETVPDTVEDPVAIITAPPGIAEKDLLDVGVTVFTAASVEDSDESERASLGAIRQAESRFIPVHLKNTLQRSGYWGAVRVVPANTTGMDVVVSGEIEESDGEMLTLLVTARDASDRLWFSNSYEAEVGPAFYRGNEPRVKDAFQDLYNRVANDLAVHRARMPPEAVREIRRVSELRFAGDFAPDAFAGHLSRSEEGIYSVTRLAARDDPMMARVRTLRERDHMLVDTVSDHYDQFYDEMWQPYESWRKSRSEEAAALRNVEREAMQRKVLGVAAIVGAIVMSVVSDGDSRVNTGTLRNAMVIGGTMAVSSGIEKGGEAGIYRDAIRELAVSFETEVTPLVVDVDGQTVELTGSAETQYTTWRRLLKDIHASETGLASAPGSTDQPVPQRF